MHHQNNSNFSTALVIIALVIAVVLLATKNKEKKVDKSENVNLSEFKNITASYQVSKNEEILVFNPEKNRSIFF